MARIPFLIQANERPVETHQLGTAPSTHHDHGPSPMPAKETLNGPTRKQLRSKYMPSRTISTGPSPWTAHKVAVVMLWRHRHLKKLKEKAKADAEKEKDLQNAVLPYGGGRRERGGVLFEGYLRHKFRPRKPSRFFFEHQARVSADASKNTIDNV